MASEPSLAASEPAAQPTAEPDHTHGHAAQRFWPLVLGSVGVVFGDIGTSRSAGISARASRKA